MHAYVQKANMTPKELHSPVQNAALVKWKIPVWVPPEARPPPRVGNPNAPAGVNTPRHFGCGGTRGKCLCTLGFIEVGMVFLLPQ
jgi:hypothetical protein